MHDVRGVRQVCGTHIHNVIWNFSRLHGCSEFEEHGAKGLFLLVFEVQNKIYDKMLPSFEKLKEWLPANFASLFVRYTDRQIGKVTFALPPPQATPETRVSLCFQTQANFLLTTRSGLTPWHHMNHLAKLCENNFNHVSQMATSLVMRAGIKLWYFTFRYDEISIFHLDISFRLRLARAAASAEEEADE